MDCKLHSQTSVQGLRFLIEKMKTVLGSYSPGIKALEQYRSLAAGYNSRAFTVKTLSPSSSSEPVSSFVYLILAAEELVKEQAYVRKELQRAKSKLKKLMERVQLLEEKLDDSSNKNANLEVKRSENEKLFEELESNFCLSKSLCSQLIEALQQSNAQVLEDKLFGESLRVDMMKSVSLRLYHSEKTVKIYEGNKELVELCLANERTECLRDEEEKASSLIEEKDGTLEELKEDVVAVNKMNLDGLASKMEELHGSRVKEPDLLKMRDTIEMLERENMDLISSNACLGNKLEIAFKEIKRLEDFINMLIAKLTELDSESVAFSEIVIQFLGSFDSCLKLVQQEKDLAALCAKQKLDEMHCQCLSVTSEKNSLQFHNQELHNKVLELEKEQNFVMAQHADECRIAEMKIRQLESELETLRSTRNNMEALISVLEDSCRSSLEILRLSDEKMQYLMLKSSEMEKKNEGLILELQAREKLYEAQKKEIMKSLADKENKLEEAENHCAQMLKGQELELSKHSNEISKKNDQDLVKKEMSLIYKHKEETKCLECRAKNELRKKLIPLRSEHEAQLSALRCEHEDKCRRLQEELDNQKAKEPRYKSLEPRQNIDLKRMFAYQTATAVV